MLELPKLPYSTSDLSPHLSEETFSYHYAKHHQTYVTNGNKLIANTEYEKMTIEEIIKVTANQSDKGAIFNNVAQVWNHNFYWLSMKPKAGGKPSGILLEKIIQDFGSFDNFKEQFTVAATTQFGSGWAWLVLENGKLEITKTANADNPLTKNQKPLLTIDVWEHAYYVDYRNLRPKYIEVFLENLINWDFAEENFAG